MYEDVLDLEVELPHLVSGPGLGATVTLTTSRINWIGLRVGALRDTAGPKASWAANATLLFKKMSWFLQRYGRD
jgi:hypothetical protein